MSVVCTVMPTSGDVRPVVVSYSARARWNAVAERPGASSKPRMRSRPASSTMTSPVTPYKEEVISSSSLMLAKRKAGKRVPRNATV
jgi:hypothetical protein